MSIQTQNPSGSFDTGNINPRKQAEQEIQRLKEEIVQQAKNKYRTLFNSMEEGFCLIEMIYDETGNAKDYRFLEVNPIFERQTGLHNVVGKLGSELSPRTETHWIKEYGNVALTGKPLRMENYDEATGRWYLASASRVGGEGSREVAILFDDITERKWTEEQLHQAAALNAFRVKLNDALDPLGDPVQILREAIRVVGEQLQVDRVVYSDVDEVQESYVIIENYVRGSYPKLTGRFSMRDFETGSKTMHQGQPFVLNDVRTFPGLSKMEQEYMRSTGIVAALAIPLVKDDRWVASLGVHHGTPREWTIAEIALLQETAERVWSAVERARAEDALRQSETRYRMLYENLRDAFVQVDMDGNVIGFNDMYCQMLGYSPEELQNLTYRDLTPERWHAFEEWVVSEQVLTRGFSDVYEKEYRRKDGTAFPVELRTVLVRNSSGQPMAMWAIIRDITDRKRAEEALRKSETRIQRALSIETVGVLFFRLDGRIIDMNDAFVKMSGYRREDLLQLKDWIELTPPEFREVTAQAAKEVAETGDTGPYEKQMIRKDGSRWWGLFAPTRLSDQGRESECVEFIVDITERKQAEKALRESEKQLQGLNESLEQMVEEKTSELRHLASELTRAEQRERNRISHILHDDMQQRIYAIQMQLSFLRQELRSENEAARKEAANIDKELEDVLNIARNLSIDLNPPILRDEGLTQAISWLASKMYHKYGLPIKIESKDSFTISDEELHVLLFNCVRELLFNIVKHAGASQAEVNLQWVSGGLCIEVQDDGRGFSLNAADKDTEEATLDGKVQPSFGLSTIRHQLSLYGGSLEIRSQMGAGTRMILTVPAVQAE
jgi:PAS domain S-box-containing protein